MLRAAKFLALACIVAVAIYASWVAYSQHKSNVALKTALGVSEVPASTHNLQIKVSKLLNEITECYLEMSPEDSSKILDSRKYSEVTDPSEKKKLQMLHIPEDFIASNNYYWFDGSSIDCSISIDATKTRLTVLYFKHWW